MRMLSTKARPVFFFFFKICFVLAPHQPPFASHLLLFRVGSGTGIGTSRFRIGTRTGTETLSRNRSRNWNMPVPNRNRPVCTPAYYKKTEQRKVKQGKKSLDSAESYVTWTWSRASRTLSLIF